MASPQWDQFRTAILQALGDQSPLTLYQLYDLVPQRVGLTEDEMQETVPSGQPRYKNRIGWMATYLAKAGAIDRPKRATFAITERGRQLLSEGGSITQERLNQFPEFIEFLHGTKGDQSEATVSSGLVTSVDETPEETIDRLALGLRAMVEAELVERLRAVEPLEFERLVLKVLQGMGYGKDGSLNTTKASHDEGIDGIISEDPLGLDRIYMQAKRYQDGSNVGIKDVMAFIGALATHQGDRGVFITSSGFTSDATNAANKANARIELIDGKRLAKLMVDNQIGVQPKSVTTIYTLDEDFFGEL